MKTFDKYLIELFIICTFLILLLTSCANGEEVKVVERFYIEDNSSQTIPNAILVYNSPYYSYRKFVLDIVIVERFYDAETDKMCYIAIDKHYHNALQMSCFDFKGEIK